MLTPPIALRVIDLNFSVISYREHKLVFSGIVIESVDANIRLQYCFVMCSLLFLSTLLYSTTAGGWSFFFSLN